jgi:hypothetical protein
MVRDFSVKDFMEKCPDVRRALPNSLLTFFIDLASSTDKKGQSAKNAVYLEKPRRQGGREIILLVVESPLRTPPFETSLVTRIRRGSLCREHGP